MKALKSKIEDSPKSESTSKAVDDGTKAKDKEPKGKHQYITVITRGDPRANLDLREQCKERLLR